MMIVSGILHHFTFFGGSKIKYLILYLIYKDFFQVDDESKRRQVEEMIRSSWKFYILNNNKKLAQ